MGFCLFEDFSLSISSKLIIMACGFKDLSQSLTCNGILDEGHWPRQVRTCTGYKQ